VVRGKLLEWWNDLERWFQEREGRDADAQATVAERHAYGRDGEVVPEIGGHTKRAKRQS
jgi:hypothetical protein